MKVRVSAMEWRYESVPRGARAVKASERKNTIRMCCIK